MLDEMLQPILKLPPEHWGNEQEDKELRAKYYQYAARRIEELEDENSYMHDQIETYRKRSMRLREKYKPLGDIAEQLFDEGKLDSAKMIRKVLNDL